VKKDEHREKLLDVIEHDVRRLDRLVSDISNASRLDSELVKEEEEEFNLLKTLSNLCQYLSQQAGEKGVDFIIDLPSDPINPSTGLRRGWRRSSSTWSPTRFPSARTAMPSASGRVGGKTGC
jgi:signal transduction histidine kinase